jgi:hypothetical protein
MVDAMSCAPTSALCYQRVVSHIESSRSARGGDRGAKDFEPKRSPHRSAEGDASHSHEDHTLDKLERFAAVERFPDTETIAMLSAVTSLPVEEVQAFFRAKQRLAGLRVTLSPHMLDIMLDVPAPLQVVVNARLLTAITSVFTDPPPPPPSFVLRLDGELDTAEELAEQRIWQQQDEVKAWAAKQNRRASEQTTHPPL